MSYPCHIRGKASIFIHFDVLYIRHSLLIYIFFFSVFDILNESDCDFSSDDSADDTTFQVSISAQQSSDESSEDDYAPERTRSPISIPSPSNSILNRGRGSRARTRASLRTQGRRGRGRRPTTSLDGDRSTFLAEQWNRDSFEPTIHSMSSPSYVERDLSGMQWHDFFDDFIDDEILNKMVMATNQTYVLDKGKSMELTLGELKVFFGICLVMAAINYPIIDLYWNRKWRINLIADAMTRDRFYTIRTRLKVVCDIEVTDEEKMNNKLWKVYPLFQRVLQGCLRQKRSEHVSIDEMIIPFTGRCGLKQYCPNKPNPVGLKVFVAANPDGLVLDMVVYQGEKTFEDYISQGFSLCEAAILRLSESLVPGHYLYFDRYFSTIKLLNELLFRGFNSTGTIMKNRIPKYCNLCDDKVFMKKPRGSTEVKCRADGKLAITKWLDNKPVVMISSCFSDVACDTCRRWNKRLKEYQTVRRPEVIKNYNSFMGGVDLTDRLLAVCPERSRTKKWTIRFIFHMMDLAVSNAWLLHRDHQRSKGIVPHKIVQLREYKLNLGEKLITDNSLQTFPTEQIDTRVEGDLAPAHKKRRVDIKPVPVPKNRKALHLPEYTDSQMRCRKEGCRMKSTVKCKCCDIYLCLVKGRNCFTEFHN